jgi:hypothetical protein
MRQYGIWERCKSRSRETSDALQGREHASFRDATLARCLATVES